MKSYELKPNYENLKDTFLNDAIGRDNDIFLFADILTSVNDNCSIALDSSWGNGKTFFVKQVKLFLDANNENISFPNDDDKKSIKEHWTLTHKNQELALKPQVNIYYDAWDNDNDEDPIISLVYAILKNMDSDFTFSKETTLIKKAASILEVFTGRDINKLIENLRSDNPLDNIRKSKDIEIEINQFLNSLISEKGNRLNIFIDELDRCKPSYAVKLLERIKHYFYNDRVTFVFSINTIELQHTIKKYYGNDFDATRYLDRFFDLRISLPPADMSKFYQSINFDNSTYTYDIVCGAVIDTYKFSFREVAKYIRLTKIAAHDPTHDGEKKYDFTFPDGKGRQFTLLYVVPIAIGLKMFNLKRYEDFVNGRDLSPLVEISYCIKGNMFEGLLEKNESYDKDDKDDKDMVIVTLEDKLKSVYNALFVNNYTEKNYQARVGVLEFDKRTKDMLFRTINILSNYVNMEVE